MSNVAVVGAGIAGLRTATLLLERFPALKISVLAADLPWDSDPSPYYASHWSYAFQDIFDDEGDEEAGPFKVEPTLARLRMELAEDPACPVHEVPHQVSTSRSY